MDASEKTAKGVTALHLAAAKGQVDVVHYLLETTEHLVDIHAQNKSNKTPLMLAYEQGFREISLLLLRHHVDIGALLSSKG
ncbi:MAG: ankyrin repeat domain-containing protein [Legionella sp.]|nr:ankyrin repeat domain-containing protein [Legionella sp.]